MAKLQIKLNCWLAKFSKISNYMYDNLTVVIFASQLLIESMLLAMSRIESRWHFVVVIIVWDYVSTT